VWANYNTDDYALQHQDTNDETLILQKEVTQQGPTSDCDNTFIQQELTREDLFVLKRQPLTTSAQLTTEVSADPTLTPRLDLARKKPMTAVNRLKATNACSGNLTPMASYGDMNTPDLKLELKKYGIKPLTKKQAVKKLVEIYEYTHKSKLKRSASCMGFDTPEPVGKKSTLRRVESSQCLEGRC